MSPAYDWNDETSEASQTHRSRHRQLRKKAKFSHNTGHYPDSGPSTYRSPAVDGGMTLARASIFTPAEDHHLALIAVRSFGQNSFSISKSMDQKLLGQLAEISLVARTRSPTGMTKTNLADAFAKKPLATLANTIGHRRQSDARRAPSDTCCPTRGGEGSFNVCLACGERESKACEKLSAKIRKAIADGREQEIMRDDWPHGADGARTVVRRAAQDHEHRQIASGPTSMMPEEIES